MEAQRELVGSLSFDCILYKSNLLYKKFFWSFHLIPQFAKTSTNSRHVEISNLIIWTRRRKKIRVLQINTLLFYIYLCWNCFIINQCRSSYRQWRDNVSLLDLFSQHFLNIFQDTYIYINLGADHLIFRWKRGGNVFLYNQSFAFSQSKNQNISFEDFCFSLWFLKTEGSMWH